VVSLGQTKSALARLKKAFGRLTTLLIGAILLVFMAWIGCTARVAPNEYGVEQVRFGTKTGIGERIYGPGVYFVGIGTTMYTFPREMHLLEASDDRAESNKLAKSVNARGRVQEYWEQRERLLGSATHRTVEALNVQTSDGYAVSTDISLFYGLENPVQVAKEFGWGSLYVDAFVINTFRSGVLATLGKMSAEDYYNEEKRIAAVNEAEELIRQRFAERGFKVYDLLLQAYSYGESYERSLQDKKVAVQVTEKNKKESLVNEERATLQQLESKGNAAITIAESEVHAQIAKIRAEAELYSSQVHAKADRELGLAQAESKRLKADALTQSGGRYVVALETAKMFENIEAAVMTPEQYATFIRNAWSLIGLGGAR
jgi:regulator of protease activity HflC (stomatin/prohibitin superfamily)